MKIDWMTKRWAALVAAAFVFVIALSACEGEGCELDAFTERPFPEHHADETMARSAEVRVTGHGLSFLEEEAENLVEMAMGDGLSFCIPPTSTSQADICHEETTCDNGSTGCQVDLDLEDVQIDPQQPNRLVADIVIDGLHKESELPVTLNFSSTDCWLDLYSAYGGGPAQIPVTVPVEFNVDPRSSFNDLTVDIEQLDIDMDGIDYNLHNRDALMCGVAGTFVNWFLDDMLRGMIADEIDEVFDEITRDQLCRSCEAGESACPSDAECHHGGSGDTSVCVYDGTDPEEDCVPRVLGIEGRIEVEQLLGDFLPGDTSDVYATARVADDVNADSGLTLGLRSGAQPDTESRCVPIGDVARPSFDPPDPLDALHRDYTPDGDPFMFGFGAHQRTIEHVLWSVWAGGALCAEVGYDQVNMLVTNLIGPMLEGVPELATRNAPMAVRLTPQQPPRVELGANEVDDGEIIDGLMTLELDDLDVHLYAFVQERYARLLTLRLDVELPVAVVHDGDNALLPVLGDFEEAAGNLRVLDDRLVMADVEDFEELIPMLMGIAVPRLMDELDDPIELPEFMGYRIVFGEDDFGVVDDDYVALFANFENIGDDTTSVVRPPAQAVISDHQVIIDAPDDTVADVMVDVDVNARVGGVLGAPGDFEYLYRFDDGAWQLAGTGPRLTIDDPRLALQGEHELQLRARQSEPAARWQREPTSLELIVDYQPPVVEIWQSDDEIAVSAEDVVDTVEQMQLRYRFVADEHEGDWSSWSDVEAIDLGGAPDAEDVRVEVEVRDRAGHVTAVSTGVRVHSAHEGGQPRGLGCSSGGGVTGNAAVVLMVLVMLLALRSRRRLRTAAVTVAVAGLFAAGCDGDPAGAHCECPSGQACVDDGCEELACSGHSDCADIVCGAAQAGVCDGGTCVCGEPCMGNCDSDEFCCRADNSCKQLPDPCVDYSCEEGYDPEPLYYNHYDVETCEIADEGGACECAPWEPVPLRYHGAYPSIDHNAGVTALAVYNIGYGDLMVGRVRGESIDEWNFVDGVPEEGNLGGDPEGPRDGINSSGENAGTHTATVVDDAGQIHVLYRHEGNKSLRYARQASKGGEEDFQITTVDDEGDVGFYTDALLRDGRIEVVYTARLENSSEVRHRTIEVDESVESISEEEYEVIHDRYAAAEGLEDYPRVAGLFLQLVEADEGLFVSLYDNVRQRPGWLVEDGGQWAEPEYLEVDDSGPYASARPDEEGRVHIAYMDGNEAALMYRIVGEEPEHVVDGVRRTEDGYSEGPVGHDVQLHLDGDTIEALYHDASGHELRRVVRGDGGGWQSETIAGDATTPGAAHGLFVRAVTGSDARYVVDFSVDTTDPDNPVGEPTIQVVE